MSDVPELVRRLRGVGAYVGPFMNNDEWQTNPLCAEAATAIEQLTAERDALKGDVSFLHKRRGELVIERDRYKAALGEYPDGRDVILSGALAEIERLKLKHGNESVTPKEEKAND